MFAAAVLRHQHAGVYIDIPHQAFALGRSPRRYTRAAFPKKSLALSSAGRWATIRLKALYSTWHTRQAYVAVEKIVWSGLAVVSGGWRWTPYEQDALSTCAQQSTTASADARRQISHDVTS